MNISEKVKETTTAILFYQSSPTVIITMRRRAHNYIIIPKRNIIIMMLEGQSRKDDDAVASLGQKSGGPNDFSFLVSSKRLQLICPPPPYIENICQRQRIWANLRRGPEQKWGGGVRTHPFPFPVATPLR